MRAMNHNSPQPRHRSRLTVQPEGIQKRAATPRTALRRALKGVGATGPLPSRGSDELVPEGSPANGTTFADMLLNAPDSPPPSAAQLHFRPRRLQQTTLRTPPPKLLLRQDTLRLNPSSRLQPANLSNAPPLSSRRSQHEANSPSAPAASPPTPSPSRATAVRSQRAPFRTSPSPPLPAPVEAGSDGRRGGEENEDDQQGEQQSGGDQNEQQNDPLEDQDSWDAPLPDWSFGARNGDEDDDWTDESAGGGGGGGGDEDGGPPGGGGNDGSGGSDDDGSSSSSGDDDEGRDESRAKEQSKKSKAFIDTSDLTVDIPPVLLQNEDDLRYRDIALVYPPRRAQANDPNWLDAMGSRIVAERQSLVKLFRYTERVFQSANADLDVALVELNEERAQFHELVDNIRRMSGDAAADEFLVLAHSKLEEKDKDDMKRTKVWKGIYNFRTAFPDPLLYDPASSSPVKDTGDESYQSVHMPPPCDGPGGAPSSPPSGDDDADQSGGRIHKSNKNNKDGKRPACPPNEDIPGQTTKRRFSSICEAEDEDQVDPDLARPVKHHRRHPSRVLTSDRSVVQNGVSAEPASHAHPEAATQRLPAAFSAVPERHREPVHPSARPVVVRRRIHVAPANAEAGPSRSRSHSGSVQPPAVFMAPPPPVAGPSNVQVPRTAPVFFLPPATTTAGPSAPQAELAAPFLAEPGLLTPQEEPAPPALMAPGPSTPQTQDEVAGDQANSSAIEGGRTSLLATLGDMAAGMIPHAFLPSLAFQMPSPWSRSTRSQQLQENRGVTDPMTHAYEEPLSPPSANYTPVNNSFVAKRRDDPIF
ncbi:hypothetical protein EIP91_000704 [Steccherinum ochraceum]|uniref:Uncharacterized protein n=1 Tax=Steccherinum ochraceum TaxID=92696 RepID=A0A4R0RLV2_9APHY|nr:hypothetical protein EIP91_000704 [Steccherinum ochraceum]